MVLCRFYSREKGWNADKDIPRLRHFYSEILQVSYNVFKKIKGLKGNDILKLNISNEILNDLSQKNKEWYLYSYDIDIGCYTLI